MRKKLSVKYRQSKVKYKELYQKNPVITILFSVLLILLLFIVLIDILNLLGLILEYIILKGLEILSNWLGLSTEYSKFLRAYHSSFYSDMNVVDYIQTREYASQMAEFFMELYMSLLGVFSGMINKIVQKVIEWFPILADIRLDLTWLLVDFSRIIRTFFNLVQFFFLWMLTRKIKNYIRKKLWKQQTDWEAIKHF